MVNESYEKKLAAFEEDSRIACQYGIKCYQKNPSHHAKYKHPPKKTQDDSKAAKQVKTGRKRRSSESEDESSSVSQREAKLKKNNEAAGTAARDSSESPTRERESDSGSENESPSSPGEDSSPAKESVASKRNGNDTAESSQTLSSVSGAGNEKKEEKRKKISLDPSWRDSDEIIHKLFLTNMPNDFYVFYDFCKSLSPKEPSNALKLVDIELVGPYDVLTGKITKDCQADAEKCLRHWRYFYDPPEFQTVLRGNNKDGLHYGYWRDDIDQPPVFIAKNSANKNCTIEPVAPNIFGAINKHINMRMARATPFEKGPMLKLSKRLKEFAKEKGLSLEGENSEMRTRDRNVVAKTFHTAGIVVPYDKKTQLGYRDLGATDSQLKRILKRIDEAQSDEERRSMMVGLEEVVRMATIAADECDFGTCLELAHDLFSSGVAHVQQTGLRMFVSAYNLLNRQRFIKIAEAHAKDRKKGCDLAVF